MESHDESQHIVIDDPDNFALLLVQQYLSERGYESALQATEAVHGLTYLDSKLPRGSMLMEMVYQFMEQQHALASARPNNHEWEAALRPDPTTTYPNAIHTTLDTVFTSAVTCMAVLPDNTLLAGTGSGSVCSVDVDTNNPSSCRWQTQVGGGGVLCMAIMPDDGQDGQLVACGSMDGSVSVVDVSTGALVCCIKPHSKYVVAMCWVSPTTLVTCSWDHTVAVVQLLSNMGSVSNTTKDAPGTSHASLKLITTLKFDNQVTAVAHVQRIGCIVVGVKGSNYLHLIDPNTCEPAGKVNMNALGDDYVSFHCAALAVSPCGRMLMVATDKPRVVVFEIAEDVAQWRQVRNLYDITVEAFQNPAVVFHKSGCFAFVVSAAGWVHVFDLHSSKVVTKVKAHRKNVRGLAYDIERDVLYTCSLDKTVQVLRSNGKV